MLLKGTLGSPTVHFTPIWLLHTVLLRHFKARWIMQESPICHHVDGDLLYQNPLSTNSVIFFIFLIYYLIHISLEVSQEKGRKLKKIKFHSTTTRLNSSGWAYWLINHTLPPCLSANEGCLHFIRYR